MGEKKVMILPKAEKQIPFLFWSVATGGGKCILSPCSPNMLFPEKDKHLEKITITHPSKSFKYITPHSRFKHRSHHLN